MLEHYLIGHCSPTLANLKTANLFGYRYDRAEELIVQLTELRQQLLPRGVELRRSGSSWQTAAIGIFLWRARWHIWRGASWKKVENSRMRSVCFSAIRWGMSRALSNTEVRTANAPAAGRYTVTNGKPDASSVGSKSADPFTAGCTGREELFPG